MIIKPSLVVVATTISALHATAAHSSELTTTPSFSESESKLQEVSEIANTISSYNLVLSRELIENLSDSDGMIHSISVKGVFATSSDSLGLGTLTVPSNNAASSCNSQCNRGCYSYCYTSCYTACNCNCNCDCDCNCNCFVSCVSCNASCLPGDK